jgi:NAD-dependent dihydropyrimidine dehydrogenase PreA subunit
MPAVVTTENCNGCKSCEDACPTSAIAVGDVGYAAVNADDCIDCNACEDACSSDAVKVK